jgi:tight adherence protein C
MDLRLKIPEISSLVRTIIIAENMGVSVSESMDRFSVDARERRFHRGERQARISSIKILFPLIFLILPIVGIIIMGPIVLQFSQSGFSMGL